MVSETYETTFPLEIFATTAVQKKKKNRIAPNTDRKDKTTTKTQQQKVMVSRLS